jgi:hypothetical protein
MLCSEIDMVDLRKSLALVTVLVAALLAPPAAIGAPIVPPGNSAVNQYTQTIPTSRGNKEVRQKGHRSPSKTLGKNASQKLQKQGRDGREAAELAAAGTPAGAAGGGSGSGGGGSAGNGGANGSNGFPQGGGAQGGAGSQGLGTAGATKAVADADDGKSGFSQVIGEVTGTSSSGDLGLLLPLAILAAAVWCGAYFWRHRRTTA